MIFLLIACFEVKPYGGETEPVVTPEETLAANQPALAWTPLLEELDALLEADPYRDADERDRLTAAHSLALAMASGGDAEDVYAYLEALVEIEARDEPEEITAFTLGPAAVEEEEIITDYDTALGPEDARALLAQERYLEAIAGLRPVKELHPELWQEAVDGYVHSERERAGKLFVQAREMPVGEVRDSAFAEVEGILEGLLDRYPESSYTEAIEENLVLVRAEGAG